MKGIKDTVNQKNKKTTKKINENTINSRYKVDTSNPEISQIPSANRLAILQSIFSSIKESIESEWLRNSYKATRMRLRKMPRGRWKLLSETFCDKFSTSVSVTEAKIFATKKRSNAELIEEKKSSF
ncbi:hypothetical protein NUSPORA_01598 [Nucleospora cyclopteri]